MDLRGVDNLNTEWVTDEVTGDITMTFKNNVGDVLLGDIVIEGSRVKSLVSMLRNSGPRILLPDVDDASGKEEHKSIYDSRTGITKTEFFDI